MAFNKFCAVIAIKLPPITIKGKKHFLGFSILVAGVFKSGLFHGF